MNILKKHFVQVKDEDGFTFIVNLNHIVSVLPLNDWDSFRVDLSNKEAIFVRKDEYEKTLKKYVEG